MDQETTEPVIEEVDTLGEHHTFNNTMCAKCGFVHDVRFYDDSVLSQEMADELSILLDNVDSELLRAATLVGGQRARDIGRQFLSFAGVLKRMNSQGPMILTLAEILDEQTGGLVSRKFAVHKCEHDLVNVTTIYRVVCNFASWIHALKDPAPPKDLIDMLEGTKVYIVERVRFFREKYIEVCRMQDIPVDQSLLEQGVPSPDRKLAIAILNGILADEIVVKLEDSHFVDHGHEGIHDYNYNPEDPLKDN